jgi:cell division protein FtsI (penicillin-binding protein 3)
MSLGLQGLGPSLLSRWLAGRVWGLEHAFERARASGRPEEDTRVRIFVVLAMFLMGFVILAIGATRAALFSGLDAPGRSSLAAGAARADLVDRNGMMLAADLLHWGLYLDPREVWDEPATRRALKMAIPGLEDARITRALTAGRRTFLSGGLTPQVKKSIHDLGLPGLSFEPEQRRVYPLGSTGAHIIGFVDSGGIGLSGAERALNDELREAATHGASAPATPLSIDLRIQAALEEELATAAAEFMPRGAVGVVTNVHTGEILGMASWPTFDPNAPGKATDDAKLDRAAGQVYEMGSTFKGFTVAIGLDTGVATPTTTFDASQPLKIGYRTIHDYHATRRVLNLVEVFQHSSNIGTAKLGLGIGPKRLEQYFRGLGLTEPAPVELRESARPLTPKIWNEDAVASTSFGHGIDVTPLALARAYGGLVNGGIVVPLTIRKMAPGVRPPGRRVVSERTSQQFLQIMRANVSCTCGSGGNANVQGLNVGGKTGTGEKFDPAIRAYSKTKQVSSFAATFPTDGALTDPRYFVLILMDEPHPSANTYGYSTGGWVAAPAAGKVIQRIAPFLNVRRRAETNPYAPVGEISKSVSGE